VLRTPFSDRFDVEVPIIQAGMGTFVGAELAAAVSNAGALGSIGAALRPVDDLRRQLARLRELTDQPFAVNHAVPMLDEEAFALTLEARPTVISLSLGDPGPLVARAQATGIRVIHQVTTVEQAQQAATRGVDAIIAQGGEAGSYGGPVATLPLVPQVVDAVAPIPVLAAGGIFDGRGVAAALVLGAHGVNIGTRFLASAEAPVGDGWKRAIVAAAAEDAARFEAWTAIVPLPGAYDIVPRTLPTPFIDHWRARPGEVARETPRLLEEIMAALRANRLHELVPFAGQSAGGIDDILPAAEIVRRLVVETETALERGARFNVATTPAAASG
jgi:nitronate monooxygenase/enoyl-[acyl-carrier protein] reductase II